AISLSPHTLCFVSDNEERVDKARRRQRHRCFDEKNEGQQHHQQGGRRRRGAVLINRGVGGLC
ncbi:hypothetical protein ACR2V4_27130, partial [Klebsiella pneumoniae]